MNISLPVFLLLAVLLVGMGIAVGYFFAQVRLAHAPRQEAQELAQLQSNAAAASARAERLEEENNALIDRARSGQEIMRALAPLAQQLDTMNRRVQGLQEVQVAQRAELQEQLGQAHRTQRELARETNSLRTALTSNSARGTWGEIELRRIVEAAGMLPHVDFSLQQVTDQISGSGSSLRPDLTIHLSGSSHRETWAPSLPIYSEGSSAGSPSTLSSCTPISWFALRRDPRDRIRAMTPPGAMYPVPNSRIHECRGDHSRPREP